MKIKIQEGNIYRYKKEYVDIAFEVNEELTQIILENGKHINVPTKDITVTTNEDINNYLCDREEKMINYYEDSISKGFK